MSRRRFASIISVALACAACERGEPRADSAVAAVAPGRRPLIAAPPTPYQVIDVTSSGTLRGTVELDGDAPPDTAGVPNEEDRDVCGTTVVDPTVERSGVSLGGVVVFLADARSGKRLPLARRFELTNEECRLVPRVQAIVAGGTLNLRNTDAATHRTHLTDVASGAELATVTETEPGQVVPLSAPVAHPALIEVRCAQHPWTRAWLAVFDHPYFAVSPATGGFVLDSIPPGRYRLVAWHERLGQTEQMVTVEAGKAAEVKVVMKGKK